MSWIFLAISGYFLLGIVNVIDKILLAKLVPDFRFYTFLIGILGLVSFTLAPLGFGWPGLGASILSLLTGAFFIIALLWFFAGLQIGEASWLIPLIGGLVPIFTLAISYLFLGKAINFHQFIAFLLLVAGTVVIARLPHAPRAHWWEHLWELIQPEGKKRKLGLLLGVIAALCFAITFVLTKRVFIISGFINGFIWIRLGSALAVLIFLLIPEWRRVIDDQLENFRGRQVPIFLANQTLGAGGFFLQNWAFALGSVALVSALQATQYVFVIVLASLAALKYPRLIKETVSRRIILEKLAAIILIAGGLFFLSLS